MATLLGGSVAGAELRLFGSIAGQVRNASGTSQMGAVVYLMNRYEKVVQRALTSPDGRFRFDSLSPDNYSVRVSLASFVPAMRTNIPVRAGLESILNIQLANLFSSIELVYASPVQTGLLSDDWKWVLRSSTATRPVLRLRDQGWGTAGTSSSSSSSSAQASVFGPSNGVVRVSAGDQGLSTALGSEPDLGTAFALATTLFGSREIAVSGNVGYASSSGVPTAGFRTRYSGGQEGLATPDVELTVRQ
ncbi:MAG: carboxypeptidase regulatory-like domain-containing protein, partial [Acidobacteria bacterium]|nr:carboxypeptidase regulatory-like domain-containing protein [Acidobacteriota bacterium]